MATLSPRDILERLITIDSTSHRSNRPIADCVRELTDEPGVRTTEFVDESGEKINLLIEMGPVREDRAGLILCGHLDVVPATEPEWQSNPFTLAEHDGHYYGRGVADMKGFVALAIHAFRSQRASTLSAPLALLLTADEELGSRGAQRMLEIWDPSRIIPKATIIGEPTSLWAVRMHKGHLTMRVTLRGRAAHSGSPHLGLNAIEPAAAILNTLAELRYEYESMRTGVSAFFNTVPHPVLNVARIRGGEALNVIPESCVIEFGVRLMPDQSPEVAIEIIADRLRRSVLDPGAVTIELINNNPPMLLDENAPIYRSLTHQLGQYETVGVSFASDGGWLARLGLETVLWGPGTIEVAHRPNEVLSVDEFHRAGSMLEELVATQCGGGP